MRIQKMSHDFSTIRLHDATEAEIQSVFEIWNSEYPVEVTYKDLAALQNLQKEQEESNLLTEGIKLAEAGATSLEEVVRVAFFD